MAFKIVQWNSKDRVCCDQQLPTDVVLCIDPAKIAQKPCSNGGETDFPWSTIDAQLLEFYVLTNDCAPCPIFRYSLRYDDTQLVDQVPLTGNDVLGLICASCLVSFIRSTAGNEVTFTQNEDGSVTITSQHGCSFTFDPAGVSVADTDSVDMHLVGSVLSADANISSTPGNQITVLADGLFVPDLANLSIVDTDSVDLTLAADVLSADVIISPDNFNVAQVRANGLFVERGANLSVVGSQSIDLNIATGLLSADLKISADPGNLATLVGDGLFVTPNVVISPVAGNSLLQLPDGLYRAQDYIQSVASTNSTMLTVAAHVLTVDVTISPDAGNQVSVQPNGLFVPADTIQSVSDTATVDLDVTANVLTANVNLCAINADGWTPACETWIFASATTITVPSDATLKYAVGDRIKLTQSATVKYFYVIDVAATLLTITGGDDYTLTNVAITDNFFSHCASVVGFPSSFSYTPTVLGFSVNPTLVVANFNITARTVLNRVTTNNGTSNANFFRVTSALPSIAGAGVYRGVGLGTSTSGVLFPIAVEMGPASSNLDLSNTFNGLIWPTTGDKGAQFEIAYQI